MSKIDGSIFTCEYFQFTPTSLNRLNNLKSQNFTDKPREDAVFSLEDSYRKLEFQTCHGKIDHDKKSLVNIGELPSFTEYKLTDLSGKSYLTSNILTIFVHCKEH